MKRLHKVMNWLLLMTMLIVNSPLIYAEEITRVIDQTQAEQAYQEAVTEATTQTVGSENVNTETSSPDSKDIPKKGRRRCHPTA